MAIDNETLYATMKRNYDGLHDYYCDVIDGNEKPSFRRLMNHAGNCLNTLEVYNEIIYDLDYDSCCADPDNYNPVDDDYYHAFEILQDEYYQLYQSMRTFACNMEREE